MACDHRIAAAMINRPADDPICSTPFDFDPAGNGEVWDPFPHLCACMGLRVCDLGLLKSDPAIARRCRCTGIYSSFPLLVDLLSVTVGKDRAAERIQDC